MKSETYLSAKIMNGRVKVEMQGPADKLLSLLTEEAVGLFKELAKEGHPDTSEVFRMFYGNVAKEVFNIDL